MKEKKKTSSHEVACFQMLDFAASKSNSEVSKSNSWKKKKKSSKNYALLQREPFLTTTLIFFIPDATSG